MSTNLLGTLGLDSVEADPNRIPDGSYGAEVMKSELVVVASKNTLNHVITYKVTDDGHKGAQKQEWYLLGNNPVKSDGTPATTAAEVANYTPAMTEQNKSWYKKRLTDLGIPEQEINTSPLDRIVGKAVTLVLATTTNDKGSFQNVKYVNPRNTVQAGAQSLADFATAGTEQAAPATAPAGTSNDPGF